MKPETRTDYIEFYANKLNEDAFFFKQQKKLINSQLRASSSLFRKRFSGTDFKIKARKYLKGIGLI